MIDFLSSGLVMPDVALFLNRITLGTFFFLARFRFFYDPSQEKGYWLPSNFDPIRVGGRWFPKVRHDSLVRKMQHCGLSTYPRFWAWVTALVEVGGGIMLIIGLFAPFAALGLGILTLFATRCTWRQKVYEQNPCDLLDACCAYLWRVEGLYIIMAAAVVFGGPGIWSIT